MRRGALLCFRRYFFKFESFDVRSMWEAAISQRIKASGTAPPDDPAVAEAKAGGGGGGAAAGGPRSSGAAFFDADEQTLPPGWETDVSRSTGAT